MSHLLNLRDVAVQYGTDIVLDDVTLSIDSGDKLALVGRNGTGKSTLLDIIIGGAMPDGGEVVRNAGLSISALVQEKMRPQQIVKDYLYSAFDDEVEQWDRNRRIERMSQALHFDIEQSIENLSGGQWRRVLLAESIMVEPDILLLDEPTNHLDMDSILWLEGYLNATKSALIVVSHDRTFIRAVAKGVLDLDRGQLTRWDEPYDKYVDLKQKALEEEEKRNSEFDKKLAQEERWIRQGIKARRTRNMGRVRTLEKLRKERRLRREVQGQVDIEVKEIDKKKQSAKRVIIAENLGVSFDDAVIIKNFSAIIERADRIGVIGPNGSGKTTLVKALIGEIAPTTGSVEIAENAKIGYFDQHRSKLNPNLNAIDNVSSGREYIEVNDEKIHIMSYMQRFLFTPDRARAPIDKLSGGECHRLLLAQLLSMPFNVLVMDEPTNDLDIETLELLEEWISAFKGTLILISHDRSFVDNTVTQLFIYEGNGHFAEHIGSYSDYLARQKKKVQISDNKSSNAPVKENVRLSKPNKKLSYNEQRELDALPEKIEELERKIQAMSNETLAADFYAQDEDTIKQHAEILNSLQQQLDEALLLWEKLEERAG